MSERTDEEIASQVQHGDTESFGILVERYESKMVRYARRFLFDYEDAEDLVQEVFIKAYVHIQGFDTRRKFSSWLYRIAHNTFINAIKKKGTEPLPFFDPDILLPHPHSNNNADRGMLDAELKNMLEECLNKLDPKYREPLVLHYIEELGYKEIAEVMHIPVSTVGVRLKRGKEALRRIYTTLHAHHE